MTLSELLERVELRIGQRPSLPNPHRYLVIGPADRPGSGSVIDYRHRDVERLVLWARTRDWMCEDQGARSYRQRSRHDALDLIEECWPSWLIFTGGQVRRTEKLLAGDLAPGGFALPVHEECGER